MLNTTETKGTVLLAIPAYNESANLSGVLDSVLKYVDDVLVIDDGSTDGTKEILAGRRDVFVITREINRGYGQAIIDALGFASGHGFEWVITMDCDLQHEPQRIPAFFEAIRRGDSDIISGSRYMAESEKSDVPPKDRRWINQMITKQLNGLFDLGITDAFCGFKAYRVGAVEGLKLTEPGYAIPLEFWVEVARRGLKVREIPVSLIYNDPNRHFGGELDDPQHRLGHYREVLERSLSRAGFSGISRVASCDCCARKCGS